MSNDLMLDVGQANELKLAFRRANFNNDDIKRLCEGDILADVKSVLRGNASITRTQHIIDCDADPYIPEGLTLKEHQKGGKFIWDATKVTLFLSRDQQNNWPVKDKKYYEELRNNKIPVLNANVLDYLLANPLLIPDEWDGNYVYFWGTIYGPCGEYKGPYVRYLYQIARGRPWDSSCHGIGDTGSNWGCSSRPAAAYAN